MDVELTAFSMVRIDTVFLQYSINQLGTKD